MSLHDALLAKAFGGGTGGGGTSIDVTAEVGQTIIVKEVDASGKPTMWESAEYPVGAKIYSEFDLGQMTYAQLEEEYRKHPIILRTEITTGNHIGYNVDIPISLDGNIAYGYGMTRLSEAYSADIDDTAGGKLSAVVRLGAIPFIQRGNDGLIGKGLLYCDGTTWFLKSESNYKQSGAILNIDPTQLTDGAMISVPAEQYADALEKTRETYALTIGTMDANNNIIMLPVLHMSAPEVGYPATVKCFDPTGSNIITVTIIPSM